MNATIYRHPNLSNGDESAPVATLNWDVLDAAYHTANAYPGGVPALAQRMPPVLTSRGERRPMAANTLQHKINPNCLTHHVSLEESVSVQELTGDFRILHAMAGRLGHVAISMRGSTATTLESIKNMVKEFGDVLTTGAAADSDDVVTPNEFRECEREAAELIASINGYVAALRARVPGARS